MTKVELYLAALDYLKRRAIYTSAKALLRVTGGDIPKAISRISDEGSFRVKYPGFDDYEGVCGPDRPRIESNFHKSTGYLKAWYPDNWDEPDIKWSMSDIFRIIKSDDIAIQEELFQGG